MAPPARRILLVNYEYPPIGGGGGPTDRNDFVFEAGIPFTLLFGDLVRFTAQPYLQVYSDKNCPSYDDIKPDSSGNGARKEEPKPKPTPTAKPKPKPQQPRAVRRKKGGARK